MNQVKTNPIWAMFSYISKVFFKSISTYVTFGIFTAILFIALSLPAILDSIISDIHLDRQGTIIAFSSIQFITIISIIVYSLTKTCSIFLDTQNEGTEILITSKPITRWQVYLARLSFLLAYGLVVSLSNSLVVLICSAFYGSLTGHDRGVFFGGTFGSCIVLFLFICSTTLLIGLAGGIKMARSFPILIFIGSNMINGLVSSLVPSLSENPITKINNNLISYINKGLETNRIQLTARFYNNSPWSGSQYITKPIKYVSMNWYNNTLFNVDTSKNVIYLDQSVSLELYSEKAQNNNQRYDYVTIGGNSSGNYNDDLFNYFRNQGYDIFGLLNLANANGVKGNGGLIATTYLNPMSAISKISGFSSLFSYQSLALNYNYNNIAPQNPFGTHYYQDINGIYFSTYSQTEQDPIWAITLIWTTLSIALFVASYFKYIRKDFK